jgi:hypothetical protein
VWASANCLIEITTLLPTDGGFIGYATRFVDESFGMALGWNVSEPSPQPSRRLPHPESRSASAICLRTR